MFPGFSLRIEEFFITLMVCLHGMRWHVIGLIWELLHYICGVRVPVMSQEVFHACVFWLQQEAAVACRIDAHAAGELFTTRWFASYAGSVTFLNLTCWLI